VTERVRLDIYPDGGMARLRVLGRPTAAAREALADRFLRLLPESQRDGLPPEVRALFRLSLSTSR
jgi:allantoicase